MILIDSNVLIDILDRDATWFDWSSDQLALATRNDVLGVTPIVVAEVGPKFASLATFHDVLEDLTITVEPLSDHGAFVAGLAFREHRRRREGPNSILADFLIGGQAAASGASILTRDPKVYTTYFSAVPLISPTKAAP